MFTRPVPALASLAALGACLISAPPAVAASASRLAAVAQNHFATGSPRVAQTIIAVPCNAGENGLSAAIATANGTTESDIISLARGCTYTLTTNHGVDDADGLPAITGTLTIDGNGATVTRSDSANAFRILHISPSGKLTLRNTNISNGRADVGAGIANEGTLGVQTSKILDNTSGGSGQGAGIYNNGNLTVTASTVDNNFANSGGQGGGIYNNATATLTASTISNNTASAGAGGILNSNAATLTVRASVIYNNEAANGGGIFNLGTLVMEAGTVRNNSARILGGGISNSGTAVLRGTTIRNNIARNGGGISNEGSVTGQAFIRNNDPDNCFGNPVPGCS
ncbi:hypothetical protein [Streptomyces sp. 900105245]